MIDFKLNTSYKTQLLLSLVIAIWLVLFLVFVGPFDTAELPLNIRFILLPPYGILFVISYGLILPVQNWLFQKVGTWNLGLELFIICLLYLINGIATFWYYRTDLVNGDYPLWQFITEIYLPSLVITTGLLLFGRWFIARKQSEPEPIPNPKIVLKGENKSDILQIEWPNLICVSSAQNYIEIFYLHQEQVNKKLLRKTMKQIQDEIPDLVRVHRSHLINPSHFIRWSGPAFITVHEMEVPVSQKYKKSLKDLL